MFKALAVIAILHTSAYASLEVPQIAPPAELVTGDYAEGTMTRLGDAEVAEFLPWAQNAHNQLNRALTQARSIPLRDRLYHIERAVKAVITRSGDRQYQMFMRFALNRGMLLVDELEKNMDMEEIGSQENALDILQRSIQIGLSFYESDLNFQNRAQAGSTATKLNYAQFGTAFMQGMYPGVVNVLDATAQYRLLYKLVEMVNWDLSRDSEAARYAEVIVEAYELGQDIPETPETDDKLNLRLIRRLNGLRIINVQSAAPLSSTNPDNRSATDTGVQISNIQAIKNPKIGEFLIDADSGSTDGICRALGFQRTIPGSIEKDGSIPSNNFIIGVNAEGKPGSFKQVTSQSGVWVKSITCSGRISTPSREVVSIAYPRANGLLYSTQSNANGVCISQGYSYGLTGYSLDGSIYGTAIVVNNVGEVIKAEQITRETGHVIKAVVCVKE